MAGLRGDDQELGLHGAARIGERGVGPRAVRGLAAGDPAEVADGTVDVQAFAVALDARSSGRPPRSTASTSSRAPGRATAGSPIDGPTFRRRSRRSPGSSATPTCDRWRGELDYWVFLDGEIGRIAGSVNGDAARDLATARSSGTIEVRPDGDRAGPRLGHRSAGAHDRRGASSEDEDSVGKRDRLARLTRVVALLRAHPDGMTHRGDRRRESAMSVRTVYRDLNAIEGEIGMPVWSEGGRWGIDATKAFLPPLKLTRTRRWRSSCRRG